MNSTHKILHRYIFILDLISYDNLLTESSVGKRRFLFLELGHLPLDSQDEVEDVVEIGVKQDC